MLSGFGVHVAGASTCEIVRCEIRNNGCPGVWVDGEDSICMVRDTVISDNGSDGCVSVNGGHCVLNGAVKVQGNKGVGIGAEETVRSRFERTRSSDLSSKATKAPISVRKRRRENSYRTANRYTSQLHVLIPK